MNPAREEILNKLKNAVHSVPERPDFDQPIYHPIIKPLEEAFKENLEMVNGFVYSYSSEKELYKGLSDFLSSRNEGKVVCREELICEKLDKAGIKSENKSELPKDIEVGITGCEFLIAHTGSVMVSSAQQGGRQMFVYPPVHVVIANKNQIVENLDIAYSAVLDKYKNDVPSHIALITGPSRTADIEKTLVLGAHGPKELIVFLLNEA